MLVTTDDQSHMNTEPQKGVINNIALDAPPSQYFLQSSILRRENTDKSSSKLIFSCGGLTDDTVYILSLVLIRTKPILFCADTEVVSNQK